jgi:phospholipid/cholesterol/gamma-HCH transport system substrate-binding protein
MKASPAARAKTGIFVVVGIFILLAGIYLIGKQKQLFSSSFSRYALFHTVSGLQVGNYVRFNGINVGIVDNISIVNDTTVRVDFSLEPRMKSFMKADAVASIGSDGLMGDKMIHISPGTDSAGALAPGQPLKTVNPIEMDKIIAKINAIADNAASVTLGLSGIVDKINNGHGSIGMLLKNDTLAKKLESTVSSARETVSSIKTSAKKFNDNMDAAKHNFLLRGYFRKKEKKRIKDSVSNVKAEDQKQAAGDKSQPADTGKKSNP